MDSQNAIRLLDDTFDNGYEEGRFLNFIRELFNGFDASQRNLYISKEYKSYVNSCHMWGSYTSGNEIIDVLAVKLNKETASWDRARTKQRNFVAKQLSKNNTHAALVAFYGDDPEDWRFSFVKLDYHFELDETGNRKIVEELTPAKRYSYLVGVNEPNHTCRRQFLDIIIEDDTNPSVVDIEDAFSIDNVTQEFFSEYKELFSELKESLDKIIEKHLNVKEEFDKKSISTVDFSKKLLGQIVFLYFLQKKGWLGVERGSEWGTGPKDFMIKLFGNEKKGISPLVPYGNFFNEILEPLFYDALSNPREGEDGYYTHFKCKIPFLNGGLFEPINVYDWVNTEIHFENKIFENIFDIFNRFNFTIKEDEPLDKEVAVDPEMLGKVFENLLNVVDRRSKGAFYTPREIVHYMCQQSLINYLETNTDVPVDDIEIFIQRGELSQQITSNTDVDNKYIPASIKNNHSKIDDLLKGIRIVDPAVGSGAFPMGMMNEIVKARSILSWLSKGEKRNYYDLKRDTIENCLYGVDIDSSAVDITKLRFWLSLVVDETDIKKIKPLPNLDHRIMCGNSLLEEFEGIKLFDEQLLEVIPETEDFELKQVDAEIEKLYAELGEIHTGKRKDNGRKKEIETELKKFDKKKRAVLARPKDETKQSTFDSVLVNRRKKSQKKLVELKRLQKTFFNERSRKRKNELAENIDRIEWELVEETLNEQDNADAMQKLAHYKKNKSKPFFLWKLYFSEVFQGRNPGFDVVIGNPPYVKEYTNRSAFDGLKNSPYYQGKMDLWYFFGCIGIDLLCEDGIECYIAPNNWISNAGASKFRNKIVAESQMLAFIDFGNYKVFTAGIQTMVYLIKKNNQSDTYSLTYSKLQNDNINSDALSTFLYRKEPLDYFLKYSSDFKREDFKNRYITFYRKEMGAVLSKIKMVGDTYLNKSETAQGVVAPQDSLNKKNAKKLANQCKVGDGIFILSDKEKSNLVFYENELELIKPYYTTNELHKYFGTVVNQYWLIYTKSNINRNISEYPHIKDHLDKFKLIITSDNKPYGLHRARNENFFTGESVVSLRKCSEPTFTYCDFDCYVSQTFVVIKTDRIDLKYLTGILNSQLIKFWFYYEGKLQGNNYQVDSEPLMNVPIKVGSEIENEMVVDLINQILAITKDADYLDNPDKQAKVKKLENQIDQLVYKLYDLTPEEIKIVEGFNEGK